MDIEWDPAKARSNLTKHGVSFSDVEVVFGDPFAISMTDERGEDEERFLTIGSDAIGRIIVVCYTYRGERIRLISARPAVRSERTEYEKGIRF